MKQMIEPEIKNLNLVKARYKHSAK